MSAPSNMVSNMNAKYSFLSKPPPPQKKRPTVPLPSPPIAVVLPNLPPSPSSPIVHNRSGTFSHITSWAALVQPGSPPPRSPRRRPSVSSSRRPSLTRLHRRPSISHSRAASGSFIIFADSPTAASLPRTATPSAKDFDLTALGYTTVFVHLPKTPSTPSPFLRQRSNTVASGTSATAAANPYAHIPIPPIPSTPPPNKRTLKHFRSLFLRPRSKSTSATTSSMPPSSPTKKSSATSTPRPSKAQLAHRKKAAYAKHTRAPPLQNELALMQFADGGSLESHARRAMEQQAKQAAGTRANGGLAVGDVYRDGKGGIWWDADEEMEYVPLLSGNTDADEEMRWVTFDASSDLNDASSERANDAAIVALAGVDNDRRGSVSTQDSDLNLAYLVEEQRPDDAILSRRVGMSVLSLPARPRRAAKHLRKPEFLVDLAAFGPRSPRLAGYFVPKSPTKTMGAKAKGKAARRRPAPLKLTPPSVGMRRCPSNSPHAAPLVDARKDFIEDSFAPSPLSPSPAAHQQQQILPPPSPALRGKLGSKVSLAAFRSVDSLALARITSRKPSRMNMRALFGKRAE